MFAHPIGSISVGKFALSDLQGLNPQAEGVVDTDRVVQSETHAVEMQKWKGAAFGNFRESATRCAAVKLIGGKIYRGSNLENGKIRKITATRIHHNVGSPLVGVNE